MKKRRQIEREFGVPIAGEILDPELWTQTALKRLPPEGPLDLPALFGRAAPLVADLGCGNGRYLIGSAVWRPALDHLGVDILPVVLRYATRRANQRGLRNIRFAAVDGLTLVKHFLRPGSVREIHCYHPQPYYDPADHPKRLVTPDFLAWTVRALEPGGLLYLQTDNAPYWNYMQSVVPQFFAVREQPDPWPDAPKGRTRREIIDLRHGRPVFRAWGPARPDVSVDAAFRLAATLPLPEFDAGPRPRALDEMERE